MQELFIYRLEAFCPMYIPRYTITNTILRHIGIIEAAKHVIDTAALLPYYEKKFQNDALVRSVHHGTHLEGNELNLSEAEKVLSGQDVVARTRDVQEVMNYRRVMECIDEEASDPGKKKEVTEVFIKKLHMLTVDRILDGNKAGEYREAQVVVKNSFTNEVSFKPPLAASVIGLMMDLINFINTTTSDDIHPVLKSGIVHYEFVRIHPFVDGNGRVGRALSTYILFQEGYDIRKFFSLEEYFDKEAGRYYQALQSVSMHDGNLSSWLDYFTEGLAIELNRVKDRVENISRDVKLKQRLGGAPLLLSDRQLKLIEYIQETGYLQNSGFKQLFPFVSEDTVLNDLKVLIQSGLIRKQGSTKAAKYILV